MMIWQPIYKVKDRSKMSYVVDKTNQTNYPDF